MDADAVVRSLQTLFERSPCLPFLLHNDAHLGLRLGSTGIVVKMDRAEDVVGFEHVEDAAAAAVPLWIDVSEHQLIEAAEQETPIADLVVRNASAPAAIERLARQVFAPTAEGLRREDTFYAATFAFQEPRRLWRSDDLPVEVLGYGGAIGELHALVTSGLSNPELGPPGFEHGDEAFSGFGYELALLSDDLDGALRGQFIAWVRNLCRTKDHIVRGNWLEYAEGILPGTSLGGFLVVPPLRFPDEFPLAGRNVWWNLLLPATPPEIARAREVGVLDVAQLILEAGFEDWSPLTRPSVV